MTDPVGRDVDRDRFPDLRFLGRGFDLDPRDATAIVYLLTLLSSTHALAIAGFLLAYPRHRFFFFTIVTFHLGKLVSVIKAFCSGARLGMRRLPGREGRFDPVPVHPVLCRCWRPECTLQALCQGSGRHSSITCVCGCPSGGDHGP